MEKALTICVFEWKLMSRDRLVLFVGLPILGAFLLSKYGLLLILPASALVLGIPQTGKMTPNLHLAFVLPAAFSMMSVQAAIYIGITAAFHSAPATWMVVLALALSLAITAGRLHGR